jgi:hypothetical protein
MRKIIILTFAIIVTVAGIYIIVTKPFSAPSATPGLEPNVATEPPALSADGKTIATGDSVLLSVDDDAIFSWFKNTSGLCDSSNIDNTPDRPRFCSEKSYFKTQASFSEIAVSPDRTRIGFDISSSALQPDAVTGIYSVPTRTVTMLTGYYLGNEFLGFSPSGKNFIYQGGCFEGLCALHVINSATLAEVASLNDPQYADMRTERASFVRWLGDDGIEYKIGEKIKQASF